MEGLKTQAILEASSDHAVVQHGEVHIDHIPGWKAITGTEAAASKANGMANSLPQGTAARYAHAPTNVVMKIKAVILEAPFS